MGEIAPTVIHGLLVCVRERLNQSVAIAKAAESTLQQGNIGKAVLLAMGTAQPIYEATTFINTASLINRVSSD